MNNVGDILLCKETFNYNGVLHLEEGKLYQINYFEKRGEDIIVYFVETLQPLWYKHKYNKTYSIWNFFYTTAELRDLKINQILEDENF